MCNKADSFLRRNFNVYIDVDNRKRARARDMKNKGNQFRLIEEKHENLIAAVKKRDKVAATKVKMNGSVKKKKT